MNHCPCGTGKAYQQCCGAFIAGEKFPSTPEELMRSRYTAYTEANIDYIARTMQSPALDHFDANYVKDWSDKVKWLKLEVVNSSVADTKGFVEFLAHFSENNQKHVIHELSEFHLVNGHWFYVDGKPPKQVPSSIMKLQTGRNDTCTCGSGKKYKKCCGSL